MGVNSMYNIIRCKPAQRECCTCKVHIYAWSNTEENRARSMNEGWQSVPSRTLQTLVRCCSLCLAPKRHGVVTSDIRASSTATAGMTMAAPVFENEKMTSLGF